MEMPISSMQYLILNDKFDSSGLSPSERDMEMQEKMYAEVIEADVCHIFLLDFSPGVQSSLEPNSEEQNRKHHKPFFWIKSVYLTPNCGFLI